MFVVVLSGTAAFGTIAQSAGFAKWATFVATLAGVVSLVFELDTKARLHASLKGRMFDLLARCETALARSETAKDCADLDAEMTRTYADEPPTMHAANALAYNAAVDAMGRSPGRKYDLKPWQILLRHWWPFRANAFPTLADRERSAEATLAS